MERCSLVQVVELSTGQLVEDVRLTVGNLVPVELYARFGGNVPSAEEVLEHITGKKASRPLQAALVH